MEEEKKEKKKKPVSFPSGKFSFYRENTYAQNILIKALSSGITDPQELKKVSGLRTVAEVYRSLDRIAIRKEYHNALMKNGMDLDFIVGGLKDLTFSSSDKIRLGAFTALLKSLGLDKYEHVDDGGTSWEDEINKIAEQKMISGEDVIEGEVISYAPAKKYEVVVPPVPKDEQDRQNRERKLGRDLYAD